MKIFGIVAVLIFFYTLSMANEATLSIDAQIEAIKKAPPEKRVVMMNALKQRLAKMNREQRVQAIERMRAKMKTKSVSHMNKERVPANAHKQQMQVHEQMSQMQNMDQKQAGDHLMHTHDGMIQGKEMQEKMRNHWSEKGKMPNSENIHR